MPFSEHIKKKVREKSHYQCCLCKDGGQIGILEIHHIIPQSEGGPDTEENAVALCPSHHEMYGNDPRKRKMIREVRDFWYKQCQEKQNINIKNIVTKDDLEKFRDDLLKEISERKINKLFINIKELIKTFFKPSTAEIAFAKLSIRQKNFGHAEELLIKEISNNPQSDEGYYLLGYVLGEQGDIEGMLENFGKSTYVSNKYVKNIVDSRKYHWANSFNKAVLKFNEASKIDNNERAEIVFQEAINGFKNAIACQNGIDLDKTDLAHTYKNLAFTYMNLGKRNAAIEPYIKVLELTKSADAYAQLGELYLQKGLAEQDDGDDTTSVSTFNQAIKVLEEGRKLHPNDANILLLLSNSYIAAQKLDVAKDAFKEGVAQEPENKFYRYNYGSLLLNAEEYEEASVQLEKALEIDSEYENAIYNLAVTYVKWGALMREQTEDQDIQSDEYKEKFEAALPLLAKYLTIKEDDGTIWDLLGRVYANLGMPEKSKEAFEHSNKYFNRLKK